jgi:putative FmdB family regulatory protein
VPIYEYQCNACGFRFERLQRMDDPPPATCERCGAASPRRLVSSPAFHLKGSGWYATDYAKPGAGSKPAGEGTSDSTAADSSGSNESSTGPATPAPSTASDTAAAPKSSTGSDT